MNIAELRGVSKFYGTEKENKTKALDRIDLNIKKGVFQAIVGTSGSGKSTLLHILGGLDQANEGEVCYSDTEDRSDEIDIAQMTRDELTQFRRQHIGFIFQNYNLVPMLTVFENIIFPLQLDEQEVDMEFVEYVMNKLDIMEQKEKYPNQLSGGQQQRVSIARALISKPAVILADEPTGNLDKKNSAQVVELLKESAKEFEQTIVMVTHDETIAKSCDRMIFIEDGKVVKDEWRVE